MPGNLNKEQPKDRDDRGSFIQPPLYRLLNKLAGPKNPAVTFTLTSSLCLV
jgi:hypothetical protein